MTALQLTIYWWENGIEAVGQFHQVDHRRIETFYVKLDLEE